MMPPVCLAATLSQLQRYTSERAGAYNTQEYAGWHRLSHAKGLAPVML